MTLDSLIDVLLSWRFIQEEAGYGVLSDIMSHAIDMAQYMCGPIRRVVATKETFVKMPPPRVFGVEDGLEYVADDELVEITPKAVRLRKVFLKENERKRSGRQREMV